ncbi:hepatitis A virus cellular receptor 1 homolog [Pelobates cultripes]|uniref:Hepatitis A virus cellular receptor 1 homolog n=1 Tax=Pelobates cultripes TaxID=61616 RepID=A0AAD1RQM6_PELCU|nr:hepatitis A virus cellular receptor 1 homolog [Pelobates cultripes]
MTGKVEKGLWVELGLVLYSILSEPAKHETVSAGDNVTLSCKYSVTGGTTTMCWGRGSCPSSKCYNEIIWTDGLKVTQSKSERYRLLGDIAQGDVSMTISGVTPSDAGTYCCRVEIPGWLNDVKKEITVEIQEDFSEVVKSKEDANKENSETKHIVRDNTTIFSVTQVTNSPDITTRSFNSFTSCSEQRTKDNHTHIPVGVALLILLILLISLTTYIYKYKCKRLKKNETCSSTLNIGNVERAGNHAIDNIYTL